MWLVLILALVVAALLLWPGPPVGRRWRRWRELRRRVLLEDVLKHIFTRTQEERAASPESVAGHLGLSQRTAVRLAMQMEAAGLIWSEAGRLHLTPNGEKLAVQVVRAHRLWETYLADEARVPLANVHQPAEQAEHHLTASQVDELDARLGHPRHDPHGDPIPTASGDIAPLKAEPLTAWPLGVPAQIAHVEDEPATLFRAISDQGLRPGSIVQVREHDQEHLTISDGAREHRLPPLAAGNIQVTPVSPARPDLTGLVRLSDLKTGEEGEVALLDPELRGWTRRRLLDLGLTSGARVASHLANAFGDPRAFRVRGTTVALRKEQASRIWVKKRSQESEARRSSATESRRARSEE